MDNKSENEILLHAAEEWRQTFDSISDYVSVHDSNFRITKVNRALADFCGMAPQEIIGKHCYELLHCMTSPWPECPHKESMKTKKPVTREINDPAIGFFLLVTTSPILDKNGEVVSCVHIAKDISEQKKTEKKLIDLNEKLEHQIDLRTRALIEAKAKIMRQEKLSAIGQFASCIRHDLRNPLGVIGNSVYFLRLMMPQAPEKVSKQFSLIEQQIEIANRIIGDILDFSKELQPSISLTAINDLIADTLKSVQIPESVEIIKDFADNIPLIHVDPILIRRVMVNLINNAVQAMHGEGTLTICTNVVEKRLEIMVRDTGCGITQELAGQIFEPLFTTKRGGIGLGLTIVNDIVTKHGGKVFLESKPDQGSVLKFMLPLLQT